MAQARGLCGSHWQQQDLGQILKPLRQKLPKGTHTVNSAGYEMVRGKLVHRIRMEEQLGRMLLPGETVHHRNGNRRDNRPENLELWVSGHHNGQRVEDRIRDAVRILERYAPELLA